MLMRSPDHVDAESDHVDAEPDHVVAEPDHIDPGPGLANDANLAPPFFPMFILQTFTHFDAAPRKKNMARLRLRNPGFNFKKQHVRCVV
jgi:hypothetical protein